MTGIDSFTVSKEATSDKCVTTTTAVIQHIAEELLNELFPRPMRGPVTQEELDRWAKQIADQVDKDALEKIVKIKNVKRQRYKKKTIVSRP